MDLLKAILRAFWEWINKRKATDDYTNWRKDRYGKVMSSLTAPDVVPTPTSSTTPKPEDGK